MNLFKQLRSGTSDSDIQPLTILRFFVAFWVVFAHQYMFWDWIKDPIFEPLRNILDRGDAAVKIFFILSGFILTHVYSDKDNISVKKFYVARFARIYPLYIVALIMALPGFLLIEIPNELAAHSGVSGWTLIFLKSISVLFLVQSWIPGFGAFWNPVSWSLSTEAFFYAIFPFLIRKMKSWSLFKIYTALAICLVLEVFRLINFDAAFNLFSDRNEAAIWVFTPIFRLPDFVTGIMIALVWKKGYRIHSALGAPAIVLILIGCMPSYTPKYFAFILLHAGCALLIFALAFSLKESNFFVRAGILLGQSSFAVYLIHEPFSYMYSVVSLKTFGHELPYLFYIILLIAISVFLYTRIESPAREILRKKLE